MSSEPVGTEVVQRLSHAKELITIQLATPTVPVPGKKIHRSVFLVDRS